MAKHDLRDFDPVVLARLDTVMWQSYYKHAFFKLFTQLIELCYTYCKPNIFTTMHTAYHSAQAAIIFRKTRGHEDLPTIEKHLVKFYKLIADRDLHPFDYVKSAELELEWWLVDRYPDRYEFSRATALARGMGAIYNVDPGLLKIYGEKREAAMLLLGRHHTDVTYVPDWQRIESLLVEAYADLHNAVNTDTDSSH